MRAQPPWSSRLAPARHRSAALRAEVGPFEYGAGHRPRGRARRPRALRCRRRTSWTTTRCLTSGRAWTARSSACTATWLRRAGVGAVRSVLVVESGRAPAVFLTRRAAPRPVAAADLQCGGSARRPCFQDRPGAGSVRGPRRRPAGAMRARRSARYPDPVCQGGRERRGARGRAGGAPAHLPGVLALRGGRAGLHGCRRARPGLSGGDQHCAVRPAGRGVRVRARRPRPDMPRRHLGRAAPPAACRRPADILRAQ